MTSQKRKSANFIAGPLRSASIIGTGSFLPTQVLTNADLEKLVETTDEWIISRTGIRERRLAAKDQFTSDLGAEAARRALSNAKIPASKVDMIICATITPDMPFPNTACLIQEKIGASKAFCFDIEAACSGFVYALEIGRQFVMSGTVQTALIIASEKLSSIVDWKDRNTCVLFGDGAGAAVLHHVEGTQGILYSALGGDGKYGDLLCMPGGGVKHPATVETVKSGLHYLKMSGKETYKHAVRAMHQVANDALSKCHLTMDDITCIIPHQANKRILEGLAARLEVSVDKVYVNLHHYGNMSAASAAVALDEGAQEGRFKRGDYIMIIAFGAGLTWGATIVQW
jgi:3-oxoacyl-[acyl-carrier-protein] synthase-3